MTRSGIPFLALLVTFAVGCGDDDVVTDDAGSNSDGETADANAMDDAGPPVDSAIPLDVGTDPDASSDAGSDVGNDAGPDCVPTSMGGLGAAPCGCRAGFTGDGIVGGTGCMDVDECMAGTDDCLDAALNGMCANTPGSFMCGCLAGFNGDGTAAGTGCSDVDECMSGIDDCVDADQNGVCTNTPGTFSCTCEAGYDGDGTTAGTGCVDIDECTLGSDGCVDMSAGGLCTNMGGSFECSCDAGYSGDGIEAGTGCSDIDECMTGMDDCADAAAGGICTNSVGGFSCMCAAGFTGDGTTCMDIDECTAGTDNCDANALCGNAPGSFDCTCQPGFGGDGVTCVPVDLFFSQYIEGSSSNKVLEIYNPGPARSLTGCFVRRYNNGSLLATDSLDLSTVMPSLGANEVLVIANPSANMGMLAEADATSTVCFYNGDDAVELSCGGVQLDVVGEIGVDPGSGWTVGTGRTNNFTLVRNHCGPGQTDWVIGATEWSVFLIDNIDGLGTHSGPTGPCPPGM